MRTKLLTALLLLCAGALLCAFCASGEEARDISFRCTVHTSDSRPVDALKDGKMLTYYTAERGDQEISVTLSQYDSAAGWIILDFYRTPKDFVFSQFDKDGTLLERYSLSDHGFAPLTICREAKEGAVRFTLTVPQGGTIANIRVFAPGDQPRDAQYWEQPDKVDLMLISTHQDDEELWFGGTLPYYAVECEKETLVVYMAGDSRWRQYEALSGLWAMGLRLYPDFLMLKDYYTETYNQAVELWGGSDAIVARMTAFIRRYKPEVIVSHDIHGEYGHPQHKVTARHIQEAILAAADETRYPDSCALYGTWEVKKLYLHLYDQNGIVMDWNTPCERLGGKTPLEVAGIGFSRHTSQHKKYSMDWGRKYDNTRFGLVYSIVGEDIFKDDFLENTPADLRRRNMEEVE